MDMPAAGELSSVVRGFIVRHLRSLEDLQVLAVMAEVDERWWDAGAAAQEIGATPWQAANILEHLARHSLLDIRVTADVRYRFHPVDHELRAVALACVAAYRSAPIQIVHLLTSVRQRSIQDFADAFRLRRDNGD